ncbi:MAG: tol-pal system protein YbgF [Pseudomonadota bacterium]
MIKKLIMTAILVTGCAIPAMAQSNDVRQLNGRISQLENQIQTLSRAVFRGDVDAQLPSLSGSDNDASTGVARLQSQFSQLEEQMRELTGQIEEQQHQIDQINRQLASGAAAPAQPQLQTQSQSGAQSGREGSQPDYNYATPEVVNPGDDDTQPTTVIESDTDRDEARSDIPADDLYEKAFVDIREGRYQEAEKGFRTFLNSYPDHKLAGNSQYWLAETYYVRGNYSDAAKFFAQGYQDYPESSKASDNLLKLGLSLAKLGNTEDACLSLAQLKDQFPDETGPVMRRANQEMSNLNCD